MLSLAAKTGDMRFQLNTKVGAINDTRLCSHRGGPWAVKRGHPPMGHRLTVRKGIRPLGVIDGVISGLEGSPPAPGLLRRSSRR